MKWYQFPAIFKFKKGDQEISKNLTAYYCPELNIRFVAHPEIEGRSILVDSLGVTDVAMESQQLAEVFGAKGN
jgi:hypothetical protein